MWLGIKLSLRTKLVNFEMSWTWLVFAQTLGYASGIYQKKKKKGRTNKEVARTKDQIVFLHAHKFSLLFFLHFGEIVIWLARKENIWAPPVFSPPSQPINKLKKLINDMTKRKNGSWKRLFNLYIISLCCCFVLRKCFIWLE